MELISIFSYLYPLPLYNLMLIGKKLMLIEILSNSLGLLWSYLSYIYFKYNIYPSSIIDPPMTIELAI